MNERTIDAERYEEVCGYLERTREELQTARDSAANARDATAEAEEAVSSLQAKMTTVREAARGRLA